MDTSDEHLQESKISMNLSCCEKNGEEVESRQIQQNCNQSTIPMHMKTIAIINQREISRESTFNYEQNMLSTSTRNLYSNGCETTDCKMLSTPTRLKELLHNYSQINNAENSIENVAISKEPEKNHNRCFGHLSRLRRKNLLFQKSSFSLDDGN